jgi:Xaa-Pro dipeptidase
LKKYDIDTVSLAEGLQEYVLDYLKDSKATLFVMNQKFIEELADMGIPLDINTGGEPGKVDFKLLMPTIDATRVIKTEQELDYIKTANKITAIAHTEILKNLKTMDNETVAEGVYIGTCIAAGAKTQAYEPIVAAGPNASTLHYTTNDEDFGDRQMLLIDAGCEWNNYACDVTRTFPISGDYPSAEAKNIYKLVEKMQEECIARMVPGVLFRDVNLLSHFVAAEGLLKLGILKGATVDELIKNGLTSAFYPHGLGHHIGLEVHDVDDLTHPIYATVRRPFGMSRASIEPVVDKSKAFALDIYVDPDVERQQFEESYGHIFDTTTHYAPSTLSKADGRGMRAGMVITVEPGM